MQGTCDHSQVDITQSCFVYHAWLTCFHAFRLVRRLATSLLRLQITGASTLGSDEVDKMVSEAEKYAEEDKKKREAVDTKNQVGTQVQVPCSVLSVRPAPFQSASMPLPELARDCIGSDNTAAQSARVAA